MKTKKIAHVIFLFTVALFIVLMLTGCEKSDRVNYNIRRGDKRAHCHESKEPDRFGICMACKDEWLRAEVDE